MSVDWSNLVLGPCIDTFGQVCTYSPIAAMPFAITAIFDSAYLELTPMGRGPGLDSEMMSYGLPGAISTEMPVLGVQLSQFPQPPLQGDVVTIGTDTFQVKEVRADSKGGAKLLLQAA